MEKSKCTLIDSHQNYFLNHTRFAEYALTAKFADGDANLGQ